MWLIYGAPRRTIIWDSERSVGACPSTVHVENLHEFGSGYTLCRTNDLLARSIAGLRIYELCFSCSGILRFFDIAARCALVVSLCDAYYDVAVKKFETACACS